jgi:hypothetical protein
VAKEWGSRRNVNLYCTKWVSLTKLCVFRRSITSHEKAPVSLLPLKLWRPLCWNKTAKEFKKSTNWTALQRHVRITNHRYELDNRGLISGRGREGYFLFATASRRTLGPTQPPIQWVQDALSRKVKQPGPEADHRSPSSAEVKNEWSYTSIHHDV